MKLFQKLLINIDKTLLGSVTVLFLAGLGAISFFFEKNDTVSIGIVYIILCVCYFICIIEYCFFKSKQDIASEYTGFKVLATKIDEDKVLLILKANELLAINTVVSVYKKDSQGIEEFVGLGFVYNIQDDDKKVQVKLHSSPEYFIKKGIDLKNTLDNKENLKIKLALNNEHIQEMINGGF